MIVIARILPSVRLIPAFLLKEYRIISCVAEAIVVSYTCAAFITEKTLNDVAEVIATK